MAVLTSSSVARLRESVRITENMQRDLRRRRRRRVSLPEPSWLGVPVAAADVNESELTGWEYWVTPVSNIRYTTSGPEFDWLDVSDPNHRHVKVFNNAERLTGGHLLRNGQAVDVRTIQATGPTDALSYWMNAPTPDFAWCRIDSAVSYGANKWQYTGELLIDGITPYLPPRTIDGPAFIYNSAEDNNTADPSIRGNSVNSGGVDYPAGFSLQPIRGTPIVRVYPVQFGVIGQASWWYTTYENADDGTCT